MTNTSHIIRPASDKPDFAQDFTPELGVYRDETMPEEYAFVIYDGLGMVNMSREEAIKVAEALLMLAKEAA